MGGLLGMDVDAVRGAAAKLDLQADLLRQIIATVDRLSGHATALWHGRDAQDFHGQWHGQHRPALLHVLNDLTELVQILRRNAAEQEHASRGTASPAGPAAPAGPASPALTHGPKAGGPAAISQALPDSGGKAAYERALHVRPDGYDQWGKAPNNCTSWAAFRRSELGLSIPYGHGGAMGHDSTIGPTPGAIASYGSGTDADPGHVMVVEEVVSPTKFRVSEMNYDLHGGYRDSQVWDKLPDGSWRAETGGAVRIIKFTP